MDKKINEKIVKILKKHGIKNAGVFGSYARGEDTSESDIDILIEVPKDRKFSLFDLTGLEIELKEKINKKIDLLTYDSIYHLLKNRILQEEIKII